MSAVLQRLDAGRFSAVAEAWRGAAVAILGGGVSLTHEQVALTRRARESGLFRVVAINDAYLLAPWADLLYFADAQWFEWHRDGIAKPALGLSAEEVRGRFAAFAGQKCSISSSASRITDPAVHVLQRAGRDGWSTDPASIHTGGHGGYQALQIAALAGADTILLLGFDAQLGHFHGEHPRPEVASVYPQMIQSFRRAKVAIAAAGVRVINASPGSAIDAFERMNLADALSARDEACV